jgi:serine/threonine-protein kinase RsbW
LIASSPRPPNVRLQLRNQPENVSLIRAVLTGVAEAIDLPRETLDDARTAVTEAANNVVLHAYRGSHGSLEVDVNVAPSALIVAVRDEGVGIPGRETQGRDDGALELGEIDGGIDAGDDGSGDGSLKLGLPVIAALASRVGFRVRTGGGTEVRMEFATPPGSDARREFASTLDDGSRLDRSPGDGADEFPLIELVAGQGSEGSELITAATIAITPEPLARSVLPRLLCALAARANFSTDRISDTQLLADAIAAQAFHSIIGEHLHVGIAVEPRQVELRVGPLPATPSERASMDGVLGKLAPVIGALADDHRLAPAGPAAVLALALSDRR